MFFDNFYITYHITYISKKELWVDLVFIMLTEVKYNDVRGKERIPSECYLQDH